MSLPSMQMDSNNETELEPNRDFLEIFQIYALEVSLDSKIESIHSGPSAHVFEENQWESGVYLNVLYKDFPIFMHSLNQAFNGKHATTVLTLSNSVFETRFVPRKNTNDHLDGACVYFKELHDLRNKLESQGEAPANEELIGQMKVNIDVDQEKSETREIEGKNLSNEMYERLKESDRMASLGLQLSGIAHEMNNPIGFIMNNLSALKMTIEDLSELMPQKSESEAGELIEDVQAMLGDLEEGALRTARIAKSLSCYARSDSKEKERTDVNELLSSTLTLLQHKTKNRIKVETEFANDPQNCECFAGRINQVFMNIIVNAIHAIPEEKEDGEIFISTKETENQVRVIIRDNGIGMSDETQKKIFEPLFTTKPSGVGTGLGMSITKEIMDEHDGTIQVKSEVGLGTEFTIILPK